MNYFNSPLGFDAPRPQRKRGSFALESFEQAYAEARIRQQRDAMGDNTYATHTEAAPSVASFDAPSVSLDDTPVQLDEMFGLLFGAPAAPAAPAPVAPSVAPRDDRAVRWYLAALGK